MTAATLFPATSMPDREWWSALWPDPEGLLRSLGVETATHILDLCCGDGYFTAHLAKISDGRVTALDLDPGMIELAKAEAARQRAAVQEWIIGDAMDMKRLLRRRVDFVLMANTFHGVPDKAALSQEVRRVLRQSGTFAIVNWHPKPREETTVLGLPRRPATQLRLPLEETRAIVEAAGFLSVKVVDLPPFHYAILAEAPPEAA